MMDSPGGLQRALTKLLTVYPGVEEPATGVQTVCLLVLAVIGTIWVLLKLASVLVPLTFAIFLAFLAEPMLATFVLAPRRLAATLARLRRRCDSAYEKQADVGSRPSPTDGPPVPVTSARQPRLAAVDLEASSASEAASQAPEESAAESSRCGTWCLSWLAGTWDVLAILLVVGVIFALLFGLVLAIVQAFVHFDWTVYEDSPKLVQVRDVVSKLGLSIDHILDGSVLRRYRGEVMSVALEALDVLKSTLLTLLLFFFVLLAMLPGIHNQVPRSPVRRLMQRYLLMKAIASFIIAIGVMLGLWLLHVKLVIIFGAITFALNFIPNIGSFFSVLAPVPFVWLDPSRSAIDVVMVVLVPWVIHNFLGTVLEPKLMASGLDLHALTIVVALTFWGSVWGVAGAILSVPITCAVRAWLMELNHPYALAMRLLLDEPMGAGAAPKAGPPPSERGAPAASPAVSPAPASAAAAAADP